MRRIATIAAALVLGATLPACAVWDRFAGPSGTPMVDLPGQVEPVHSAVIVHDQAVETTFDGPLVEQMVAALKAEDDGARPVPFTMSGGTDAKSFERLGIRCFGFSPLRLPPDLDFAALFHGIDERVPVESLKFGIRVLDRFLRSA